MPEIRVLDDATINKIAAGEVIERPASVVKELVENSLDAGATEILTTVEKAGKTLVRVVDNGCGIPPENVALAFERHATSKIQRIDDLDRVTSMGFRGEALSSIASVASVSIHTRTATSDTGVSLALENGKVIDIEEVGMERGTAIEVRNLFANLPARAKFLKGDRVEFSHILRLITERTLANPGVAFRLVHNGSEVLNYPAADTLADRFLDVFGREAAKVAVEIGGGGEATGEEQDMSGSWGGEGPESDGRVSISGMLAKPEISRTTTADLHIFVNGRPVSEPRLRAAIEEGYAGMLMVGRHPVGVVFIDVDPASIDVNVHPTKREIKFEKINIIMKMLAASVSDAMVGKSHIREAKIRPLFGEPVIDARGAKERNMPPPVPSISPDQRRLVDDDVPEHGNVPASVDTEIAGRGMMPKMRPIGQILDTFILAQSGTDLLIIDQHAAHERVMLERVKARSGRVEQKLITPLPLEVSSREFELLAHYRPELEELGFAIEPFGRSTYLVRAVPAVSGRLESPDNLREMVHELAELGKARSMEKRGDEIRHLVACHSAIRAGETLDIRRMKRLIEEMRILDNPFTCAHGRPTIIKITERELEKMFKRVV